MTGRTLDWPMVEAAAGRAGWKRTGAGEWHGPCPLCGGGPRRAWIRPGDRGAAVVAGCHAGCSTGLAVAAALAGVELSRPAPRSSPKPARQVAGALAHGAGIEAGDTKPGVLAAAVWSAAGPVGDSPGREYLRRRLGRFEREHHAVRWLPRAAATHVGLVPALPTSAGALCYAFTDGSAGPVRAVQVEAVAEPWPATVGGRVVFLQRVSFPPPRRDPNGTARKRPSVWRSDFGGGRRMFRATTGESPIVLVEGPLDALGLAALWPGADVRGVAGAGAIPAAALAVLEDAGLEQRIVIAADADGAGRAAATRAVEALHTARAQRVEVWRPESGRADWSDIACEAAVLEMDAERSST